MNCAYEKYEGGKDDTLEDLEHLHVNWMMNGSVPDEFWRIQQWFLSLARGTNSVASAIVG